MRALAVGGRAAAVGAGLALGGASVGSNGRQAQQRRQRKADRCGTHALGPVRQGRWEALASSARSRCVTTLLMCQQRRMSSAGREVWGQVSCSLSRYTLGNKVARKEQAMKAESDR